MCHAVKPLRSRIIVCHAVIYCFGSLGACRECISYARWNFICVYDVDWYRTLR